MNQKGGFQVFLLGEKGLTKGDSKKGPKKERFSEVEGGNDELINDASAKTPGGDTLKRKKPCYTKERGGESGWNPRKLTEAGGKGRGKSKYG